jgi:hypothetical protein
LRETIRPLKQKAFIFPLSWVGGLAFELLKV